MVGAALCCLGRPIGWVSGAQKWVLGARNPFLGLFNARDLSLSPFFFFCSRPWVLKRETESEGEGGCERVGSVMGRVGFSRWFLVVIGLAR